MNVTRQSGQRLAQAGVDAFEQVRLAGADGAVNDERVGPLARRLDDALGRRRRPRGCTGRRRIRPGGASGGPIAAPRRLRPGPCGSNNPVVGFSGIPRLRRRRVRRQDRLSGRPSPAFDREPLPASVGGSGSRGRAAACSARAAWNNAGSMTNRTGTARPAASLAAALMSAANFVVEIVLQVQVGDADDHLAVGQAGSGCRRKPELIPFRADSPDQCVFQRSGNGGGRHSQGEAPGQSRWSRPRRPDAGGGQDGNMPGAGRRQQGTFPPTSGLGFRRRRPVSALPAWIRQPAESNQRIRPTSRWPRFPIRRVWSTSRSTGAQCPARLNRAVLASGKTAFPSSRAGDRVSWAGVVVALDVEPQADTSPAVSRGVRRTCRTARGRRPGRGSRPARRRSESTRTSRCASRTTRTSPASGRRRRRRRGEEVRPLALRVGDDGGDAGGDGRRVEFQCSVSRASRRLYSTMTGTSAGRRAADGERHGCLALVESVPCYTAVGRRGTHAWT